MKQLKYLTLLAISTMLILTSCKEEKELNLENDVRFTTSFMNYQTKSSTTFTNGYKAIIYGFNTGSLTISANNQLPDIATSNNGSLELSKPLTLPKGTYDFYCLSKNDNSIAVNDFTITNNYSQELEQNTDYIFASSKDITLNNSTNINFNLLRLCSKITINLTANTSQGVSDLSTSSMKIKLPQPGSGEGKLDFNTGEILKCSALTSNYNSIDSNGSNSYTYIVLPCTDGNLQMELQANMNIGGSSYTGKTFYANTNIPGGYVAGKHYILNATVGAKVINFPNTTVEDWDDTPINGIEFSEN